MPMPCTTCAHPSRNEIDIAIVRGASAQAVALEYGLNPRAVQRHAESHIPRVLARAEEAVQIATADHLLAELRELCETTKVILLGALADEYLSRSLALDAIREQRANLALLAKVCVELEAGTEARRRAG